MKEIKETLLRVLYPRRCPICHGIVASRGEVVHPSCAGRVPLIGEPRCKRCGKGLEREEEEYCRDCMLGKHRFTRGLAAYAYDETMKLSIYQMKFHNKREYADFYVRQSPDTRRGDLISLCFLQRESESRFPYQSELNWWSGRRQPYRRRN